MSSVESTPLSIAWAAGIFDGEGCMSLTYSKTVPVAARRVRIDVGMTDLDILERLQSIFGGKIYVGSASARFPHAKQMYRWRIATFAGVGAALEAMLPWFGERRTARANELLAAIAAVPPSGTSGKPFCKNGHPLTPENLMRRGNTPYRRCKTCAAAHQRAYRERLAVAS